MIPRSLFFTVKCVLSIWTIEYAAGCGERQKEDKGRCCDLCPPGTYMKGFCSEPQVACIPCKQGYFSDEYASYDRCEECLSCQQEYVERCTLTRNANCSCRSGFLCSDSACSKCEENKCVKGERLKRTGSPWGGKLMKYSYQCEPQPSCPDYTYFDVKEDICKTHRESIHLILGIGLVLLSLTLPVFLFYICIKNLRKHKAPDNPVEVLAVPTNATDFHLSKEESGIELMVQDESKNSNSFSLLHL